ncbi:hypothetical protein BJ742DRAFT_898078 [Cladochytrium replicatum]|nr:hypothetical protein BJ742DRAFT_898078 [Cladochytrium replicatum]
MADDADKKWGNLPKNLASSWIQKLTTIYLIPEGPFLSRWKLVVVIVNMIYCILLPFMEGFHFIEPSAFIVGYLINVFFLEMALQYMNSNQFKFDIEYPHGHLCACVPERGEVAHIGLVGLTYVRLFKIIRVARVPSTSIGRRGGSMLRSRDRSYSF